MCKIRLTDAQLSALQCAGLFERDDLTNDEDVLRLSVQEHYLVVSPNTREAIARALNELSNAEDAAAVEQRNELAIYAARAARSLSNLYSKVLRIEMASA